MSAEIAREVLSNVTDYKGTGEVSPKGSISWSDFDFLKRITADFKLQPTCTVIDRNLRRQASLFKTLILPNPTRVI